MPNTASRGRLWIVLALAILAFAGCRQSAGGVPIDRSETTGVQIDLAPAGDRMVMGPVAWTVTLTDADGRPIEDATVTLRGDMNHAGMAPEQATAAHTGGGVYTAEFTWTMAGDWIVTVSATLADGTVVSQIFNYSVRTQ